MIHTAGDTRPPCRVMRWAWLPIQTRTADGRRSSWPLPILTHGGAMPTYLITYHGGGGPPASAEAREQMMAAFGAWVGSVGDHMVDPGAPLGASKTVSTE